MYATWNLHGKENLAACSRTNTLHPQNYKKIRVTKEQNSRDGGECTGGANAPLCLPLRLTVLCSTELDKNKQQRTAKKQ